MRAIPLDIREAVVKWYFETKDVKKVCKVFGISKSSMWAFVKTKRSGGTLKPKAKSQPRKFNDEHCKSIVSWATQYKGSLVPTLKRLSVKFKKVYRVTISCRTIRRILKRANLSYKRAYRRLRCSRKPRKSNKNTAPRQRVKFAEQLKFGVRFDRILSLDETGWRHGIISPARMWSRRGRKHECYFDRKCCMKPSMMCLIDSRRGIIDYDVLFSKGWNSRSMESFLRRSLIGFQGYHLIMDNVAFHHTKKIKKVLEEMGITPIYIDPYTPTQNPIEELFSPIKAYIAARIPVTDKQFIRVLNSSLRRIRPKQVTNYFCRALTGYGVKAQMDGNRSSLSYNKVSS